MKLLICVLLATTTAIRNGHPRPMPRSQPTTLETLLGHDPIKALDIRGGGIFDDPDEEGGEEEEPVESSDDFLRPASQRVDLVWRSNQAEFRLGG